MSGAKLLHGVGFPVGGGCPPNPAQLPPLLEMIAALAPSWMSEHLAFNRADDRHGAFQTGFLLPPLQTRAGADAAVASIRSVADRLPIPFAVEHGVSYLRRREDEWPDGDFLASVTEGADCGIVLDLHNGWTNHRNGRQDLDEFLAQLPLERIWEVHLAGGMEYEGYWLDAHSGEIPAEVLAIAREVIPRLFNLRALIFEIMPSFVEIVGLDTIGRQLDHLHELWQLRRPDRSEPEAPCRWRPALASSPLGPTPREWENTLGALVIGREAEGPLAAQLVADPGLGVFRHLVAAFRASSMIGTLPFTGRLLLLALGDDSVEQILSSYWRREPPEAFGTHEARRFAAHLNTLNLSVPFLSEVLAYDLAVIAALADGTRQHVAFSSDPRVVLGALADHRWPEDAPSGRFVVEVRSDGIVFHGATMP